jgi:hypothetical protein
VRAPAPRAALCADGNRRPQAAELACHEERCWCVPVSTVVASLGCADRVCRASENHRLWAVGASAADGVAQAHGRRHAVVCRPGYVFLSLPLVLCRSFSRAVQRW